MGIPSNVVQQCFAKAFKANSQVLLHTGQVAGRTPFEATVVFETASKGTFTCKWRNGQVTLLG